MQTKGLEPLALMYTLLHTVREEKPQKLEETLSYYVRRAPCDTLAKNLELRTAEAFGDILSDVKAYALCNSLAATQADA